MIADWIRRRAGFAQGMLWTCTRLGGAVARCVLWLISALGGWETPFWITASLVLLWCAFVWPWFRDQPAEMRKVNAAERDLIAAGRNKVPVTVQRLPWSTFLRSRNVWALSLMYGFQGFGGNFITSLLPIYLRDHRNLSKETTAWMSGWPLACGIVSCLLGGVLSDRLIRRLGSRTWGRRIVSCVALSLAAAGVLTPIWADSVFLAGAGFGAMFFFNDANLGPAWAACARSANSTLVCQSEWAMNMTGSFSVRRAAFAARFHRKLDESYSLPTGAVTRWQPCAGSPSTSRNRWSQGQKLHDAIQSGTGRPRRPNGPRIGLR